MLHQLQTIAVFFTSLVYRDDGPSQRCQLAQFLLDILEPFMSLSVRYLVQGSITLLTTILFVQLVNLGDFCP